MTHEEAQQLGTRTLYTAVMPCCSAQATIAQAIQIMLVQSEQRFELIVANDGSPDDCAQVAAAAFGNDPRCRMVHQDNAGPAAAHNSEASLDRGTMLAFLDADDRWVPDILQAHAERFAACIAAALLLPRRLIHPIIA